MRNRILTTLFCLMLAGPTCLWCFERLEITVPDWLSTADAKYLTGGSEAANLRGNLNSEDFLSGRLQTSLVSEVENRIPAKASLMLASASVQRNLIRIANLPFAWECYPTYYGSKRIYVPEYDSLGYLPRKRNIDELDSLRALASNVSRFAINHPNVRICVCVVLGYQDAAVNPAYALTMNPSSPTELLSVLKNEENLSGSFIVVGETYEDMRDYLKDFFKTDHHWNWRGTERAYGAIATQMDLRPISMGSGQPIGNYKFSGATARWALDLVQEDVSFSEHDFSDLVVSYPDGKKERYNHSLFENRTDAGKKYGFYDSYYNFLPNWTTLYGGGNGKALVISNSYGGSISPYIAQNYYETIRTDHIHPSSKDTSFYLSEYVSKTDNIDIFIVGNPSDLASFSNRRPDYFEEL